MAEHKPTITKLEPALTKMRMMAQNYRNIGDYEKEQKLLDVSATIEGLESENTKLRELCKELLDLCYDAYEQKWGWDDDWALAYEQAKKLGVEVSK